MSTFEVVRLKAPKLIAPKISDMEKRLATAIVHARRHFEQEVSNLKRDVDELRRDHDVLAERLERLKQ